MKLTNNTILITGGAAGIGLAMAERFLAAGNEVIVCGRSAERLQAAKSQHPRLHTIPCDVASEAERIALVERVTREFPALNVLVNNAGIQRRVKLTEGVEAWAPHQQELTINLEAPIHLALLLVPHLRAQAGAAIINVTSGLAFAPMAGAAVYCATKAALHSFTQSLRLQLAPQQIEVIEVIPPAVQTDLGGAGLHTFGVPLDEFGDAVFEGLKAGKPEIGYGSSELRRTASRAELDAAVQQLASVVPF